MLQEVSEPRGPHKRQDAFAKEAEGRTASRPLVASPSARSSLTEAAALLVGQPAGDKKQREPTDRCRSKGDKTPAAHPTCTTSARCAEIGQQHQICFVVRHQIFAVLPECSRRKTAASEVTMRLSRNAFAQGVQVNQACQVMGSATTTPHDGRVARAF